MNERNEWMKLQVFQGAGITDGAGIGRSRFLALYSGFQNPGFPNPQEKKLNIPDFTSKNSPDSGIRIPLHGENCVTFLLTFLESAQGIQNPAND